MSKEVLNNHFKKILHKSDYIINESPKYHPIMDEMEGDDILPDSIAPTPVSSNDSNVMENDENVEDDNLELDDSIGEEVPEEPIIDMVAPETEEPGVQDSIDKVQNEIIKLNISTMKKIQSEVEGLGLKVDSLTHDVNSLDRDVDEVKEPSDVEKLTSRKDDSHPFYMNLNDMWKNNEFQARRDEYDERGMKKLDDGTYIADFDMIKGEFSNNDNF